MLRTCLFSMNETDLREPLRAGASDDELEADHPRRRLAQGAQAPHQRRGLRAAGALDVAHRRVKELDEALGARPGGRRAARGRARAARPRPRAGSPPRTGRSAVDLPPFDRSAMDGYAVRAADTAPAASCALAGDDRGRRGARRDARAGHRGAASPPARAIPPGADAVLQSELAELDGGSVRADAGARARHARPLPRRGRARRRPARAAPASRSRCARLSSLAAAGRRRGRRPPPRRGCTCSSPARELLPLGAPPEPGKIHESNGLMVRLLAERAGAAGRSTTA